ncbi:MAG: electron transport complex subunit RsxG [Aeromonadaceae bacterium]
MHNHASPNPSQPDGVANLIASLRRNSTRLALFAIVCTSIVAITNALTHDVIAQQAERDLQITLGQMLPADQYDNNLADSCVLLTSPDYLGDKKPHPLYVARKQGQVTGYIVESIAPNGYSGAIRLLTSVMQTGEVSRVQVLEHHETPGLGDKIERKKSTWIDRFTGQSLQSDTDPRWAVKKDGGEFDSFTGATITPRAVVGGVKNVLLLLRQHPELISAAPACPITAE